MYALASRQQNTDSILCDQNRIHCLLLPVYEQRATSVEHMFRFTVYGVCRCMVCIHNAFHHSVYFFFSYSFSFHYYLCRRRRQLIRF